MKAILSQRDRKCTLHSYYTPSTDPDRAGGISISGTNGRIDINNTFEERLRLLESESLPVVRSILFGENENRKFKD
jgi:vacuolar-type H+-ATPase subunit E/Vma4